MNEDLEHPASSLDSLERSGEKQVGAWAAGLFANDGALEFIEELESVAPEDREQFIRQVLEAVAAASDYVPIDDCEMALAAAAALSALHAGTEIDGVDVPALTDGLSPVSPLLRAAAVRAVDRVTHDPSEWLELWGESGEMEDALIRVMQVRNGLLEGSG